MKKIVANKIRQGRVLNAISQQELADMLGVSKQMISKYEKAESMPSSANLIKLANALKVRMDYFFLDKAIELGEINFRKKSNFSAKKIDALKENIKMKLLNYLEIEEILQVGSSFEIPTKQVKLSPSNEVAEIAHSLRNEWEIGLDPVHNIIQLFEDKGIKVIEIDEQEDQFDGLATVINKKIAVIVINKNFNVERKRFTLLHELGHLLLELPGCDKKTEENICNKFASEFLFPNKAVLKEFGIKRERISFNELIEVQIKYGISIRAIVYRLFDVGIFNENRHKEFYKKLHSNPCLKRKVDEERFQTPEFSHRFQQLVYRALSQELISASKAASLLNVTLNEVLENFIM